MKTSHYYSVDGADACIRPTMHWVYKAVESVTSPEFNVLAHPLAPNKSIEKLYFSQSALN